MTLFEYSDRASIMRDQRRVSTTITRQRQVVPGINIPGRLNLCVRKMNRLVAVEGTTHLV